MSSSTDIQCSQIEPSEKGIDSGESMMLKIFYEQNAFDLDKKIVSIFCISGVLCSLLQSPDQVK